MKTGKTGVPVLLSVAALFCVLAVSAFLGTKRTAPAGKPDFPDSAGTRRPDARMQSPVAEGIHDTGGAASGADMDPSAPSAVRARTGGETDPVLRSLAPSVEFGDCVRSMLALPAAEQVARGRGLLVSGAAKDRALGGVLLFFNRALEGDALRKVAGDGDISVPLTVFDWIRDFGSDEEIADFAGELETRSVSDDELAAYLATSASRPGGGRSALDLLLARQDEETVAEALEPVLSAPGVSHDVLEQAVFKMLEPENKAEGLSWLETAAGDVAGGASSLRAQSVAKWTETAHLSDPDDEDVPYKVWDTPLRELSHLAESDLGLAVRTMANYLEYGLRRDDPDFEPVVEEGSWEVAKAFLDRALANRGRLPPEEADALDRLSANLDRIKAYDPAFAPDDDGDDPFADEEIDVEVLDAEDAYVAEYLTSDDEGEDPEDEEDEDLDDDEDGDDEEDEDPDEDEDDPEDDSDDEDDEDTDDEDSSEDDSDDEDDEDDEYEDDEDDDDESPDGP